jgi:hypothetical protein
MIPPRYIGDGVYIQVDSEDPTRLILTTGSHKLKDADNVVYLELDPIMGLVGFIKEFTAPS